MLRTGYHSSPMRGTCQRPTAIITVGLYHVFERALASAEVAAIHVAVVIDLLKQRLVAGDH